MPQGATRPQSPRPAPPGTACFVKPGVWMVTARSQQKVGFSANRNHRGDSTGRPAL